MADIVIGDIFLGGIDQGAFSGAVFLGDFEPFLGSEVDQENNIVDLDSLNFTLEYQPLIAVEFLRSFLTDLDSLEYSSDLNEISVIQPKKKDLNFITDMESALIVLEPEALREVAFEEDIHGNTEVFLGKNSLSQANYIYLGGDDLISLNDLTVIETMEILEPLYVEVGIEDLELKAPLGPFVFPEINSTEIHIEIL